MKLFWPVIDSASW